MCILCAPVPLLCREEKERYEQSIKLMQKLSEMTMRFEEEEKKLYVDMSVTNPLTTAVTAHTVCVEFSPDKLLIKVWEGDWRGLRNWVAACRFLSRWLSGPMLCLSTTISLMRMRN